MVFSDVFEVLGGFAEVVGVEGFGVAGVVEGDKFDAVHGVDAGEVGAAAGPHGAGEDAVGVGGFGFYDGGWERVGGGGGGEFVGDEGPAPSGGGGGGDGVGEGVGGGRGGGGGLVIFATGDKGGGAGGAEEA